MKAKSIIFLGLLLILSCDKGDIKLVGSLEGTYKGIFFRSSPEVKYQTSNVILVFDAHKFEGSGNITKYPAICHGTYTLIGQEIEFTNLCPWTAEFDWSLILSGKFKIEINGDELVMTRSFGNIVDTYKIQKQQLNIE